MRVAFKRATVIGGLGFIGSHLVRHLEAQGWDCWIPRKDDPALFNQELGHIFYCAGLTADYVVRSFDVVDAHVTCLNKILHFADFNSLVYLSSTRLYDSQSTLVAEEEQNLTFNPTNPRHIYDLSKALGESLCHVAGKSKARIARLSCVYSDQTDTDGFLPGLLRQVLQSQNRNLPIEVNSSSFFIRDYVALQDVLTALVMIATEGKQILYNVASGENVSNSTIFAFLEKRYDVRIIPLDQEQPTLPAKISICRLQKEFSWQPVGLLKQLDSILKDV
jgi:nucleoside-diphosphate-sugar epimerase